MSDDLPPTHPANKLVEFVAAVVVCGGAIFVGVGYGLWSLKSAIRRKLGLKPTPVPFKK